MKTLSNTLIGIFAALLLGGCDAQVEEPGQVILPVSSDGSGLTMCTNAEGFEIELASLRVAIRDVAFTIEGETHAGLLERLNELLIPSAFAHPGHYAGGEVTGELAGDFLLDLAAHEPTTLGDAVLLEGAYNGMNLSFRRAGADDGLGEDDHLLGHTAEMIGTATRGDRTIEFTALIDVAEDTQMVGAPFALTVTPDTRAHLAITAFTIDPSEGDTLFDGLDFELLDSDQDDEVLIQPGDGAHNVLMKTLIRHDHWGVVVIREE